MIRSTPEDEFTLSYEENISIGDKIELSSELIDQFLSLFGEDLLEKCRDLPEGLN